MSFCPRCGAPTSAGMSFCTSCGEALPARVEPALVPAPAAPAGVVASSRPRGETQEPWLVVVLVLVTFGIYQYIYWWRVSREVDTYRGTPGHAHHAVRVATFVGLAALALGLIGVGLLMSALFSNLSALEAQEPSDAEVFALFAPAFVLFPFVLVAALVAFVFWLVGLWRVWSGIAQEERARGRSDPLSPGVQLAFVLVPYVNLVTLFVALYRTQDRLNALWRQG
jgi:hypothetical protein